MRLICTLAALSVLCLVAAPAAALSNCSFEMNRFGIPTKESMYKCAVQLAREHGIDPCFAVIGMNHENGMVGRYSVGYDLGKNGERYDESRPDLGLDFKNRHYGLGPLQVTLGKGVVDSSQWCQAGVPSIKLDGSCYLAQGLVTPLRGLRAGVLAYKRCGAGRGDPGAVWPCVAGTGSMKIAWVKKEVDLRIQHTRECLAGRDATQKMQPSHRCRGDAPVSQKACHAESAALVGKGRLGYDCDHGCVDFFEMPVKNAQLVWDDLPGKKARQAPAPKKKR